MAHSNCYNNSFVFLFHRIGGGVTVSRMDDRDPIYTSLAPLELNKQCLAGSTPLSKKSQVHIYLQIITVRFPTSRTSPLNSLPFLRAGLQIFHLCVGQHSEVFLSFFCNSKTVEEHLFALKGGP